jgi:pyruvate dehydrogenase E2 component (dihydrolipoamide acetyltransferase)
MTDFRMPSLGADMTAGTVVEWLVGPGDRVKRGDIIAVVETDKGAIEIEIFQEGTVQEILAPIGEEVPVGTVLARLDGGDEPEPAQTAPPTLAQPVPQPSPSPRIETVPRRASPGPRPRPGPGPRTRLHISPIASRRAEQLHIDPAALTGTGVDGAIVLADVEAAAETPLTSAPVSASGAGETVKPAQTAMRNAIAAAMSRANRDIPHYYLQTTIDMESALGWLEASNRERSVADRLLYSVLLLKAVGLALQQVPGLHGFWENDAFRAGAGIHIGWSVSLRGGGLVAPAVHDVDKKPLTQLMAEFRDLVKRARRGGLRSSEMTDAAITITSLGEQGVESVFGIIYPPQVALIGFGKIHERPWADNGMIGVHRVIEATLSGDHRASDGHTGGLLLAAINHLLQEPEKL